MVTAMYCKRCKGVGHLAGDCPIQESDIEALKGDPAGLRDDFAPKNVHIFKEHCPICKGDKSLIEDAEKWRRYREKRRLYMRKRRL